MPEFPSTCAECGVRIDTEAEAFLHACLHSGDPKYVEFGNSAKPNRCPYILFPVIALMMEEYKRSV